MSLCLLWGCTEDEPNPEDLDFAYVSANPPSPELISIQAATLGQRDWVVAEPARPDRANITPHFSPDGQLIAFEQRIPDLGQEVGRLRVVDAHSGEQTELTRDIGHDERCQLLPRGWDDDGQRVAFVCNPVEDGPPRQVGFVDIDGDVSLLEPADDSSFYTDIQFGSDADILVLSDDESGRSLRRIDADNIEGSTEIITEFDGDRLVDGLRLSPDNSRVAMIRATDTTTMEIRPESSVIVVDLQNGTQRTLLGDGDAGHHSVEHWHPDGDRLLVATGGYGSDPGPLRLVDIDGGDLTTLVDKDQLQHGTIRRGEISPDGDTVIFSDNDSDDDEPMRWTQGTINIVDIDGGDLQQFNDLSVSDEVNQPTFNPAM